MRNNNRTAFCLKLHIKIDKKILRMLYIFIMTFHSVIIWKNFEIQEKNIEEFKNSLPDCYGNIIRNANHYETLTRGNGNSSKMSLWLLLWIKEFKDITVVWEVCIYQPLLTGRIWHIVNPFKYIVWEVKC